MSAVQELLLLPLALLALQASLCHGACVEVDSDTEAVVNKGFKLGCISCKMRGEVKATAQVNWYFKASNETNFTLIYNYENKNSSVIDPRFEKRLDWNGSKDTVDIQDGSIYILNVSFDDMGTYRCFFDRTLKYLHPQIPDYEYPTRTNKTFILRVVPQLTRGLASILSEVMMYVSIIGLQVWLVIEMIYCYRKIAAAGEEALRESASRRSSRLLP
ncbi:sodium channel, voltage-gated, type I, beta a isoform X2 [Sebastes umbrosus]|uniref:sodium channel, voltage-gated, type I, beta a isoform X2 n=1 Tax=Sebastes umbrosus TaxID=72105 RepID=UPI00189EDE4F|nr:sodium channel, voltage-gated, type I, beta a isoform X2 [Sebastes umbrosus]